MSHPQTAGVWNLRDMPLSFFLSFGRKSILQSATMKRGYFCGSLWRGESSRNLNGIAAMEVAGSDHARRGEFGLDLGMRPVSEVHLEEDAHADADRGSDSYADADRR